MPTSFIHHLVSFINGYLLFLSIYESYMIRWPFHFSIFGFDRVVKFGKDEWKIFISFLYGGCSTTWMESHVLVQLKGHDHPLKTNCFLKPWNMIYFSFKIVAQWKKKCSVIFNIKFSLFEILISFELWCHKELLLMLIFFH